MSDCSVERCPIWKCTRSRAREVMVYARCLDRRCQLFFEMVVANPVCSHLATCMWWSATERFVKVCAALCSSSQRRSILAPWLGRSSLLLQFPHLHSLLHGLSLHQGVWWHHRHSSGWVPCLPGSLWQDRVSVLSDCLVQGQLSHPQVCAIAGPPRESCLAKELG